jgi:chromosome segregation ATPase
MTDAVSELRSSGDRFEQFVGELLQDLENLQGELQQRGRELERQARQLFVERDRIATEQGAVSESLEQVRSLNQQLADSQACVEGLRAELSQLRRSHEQQQVADSENARTRFAALETELIAARADLNRTRTELTEARNELIRQAELAHEASASSDPGAQELLQRWRDERQALQAEVDAARTQAGRLAGLAIELADARSELAQARAELVTQSRLVAEAQTGGDPVLRDKVHELEQERASLEAELEAVRNRSAELVETINSQRRQMADERAEWSGELREMRRAMDLVARQSHKEEPEAHEAQPAAPVDKTAPRKADPVVSTVMAQFESLQRDLKRRRLGSEGSRQEVA